MPIQKSLVLTNQTSGDYWKIKGVTLSTEGNRQFVGVLMDLWKDSGTPAIQGATPILQKTFNVPASVFTAAQLTIVRNVCQGWLVANDPTLTGGTII